MAVNFLDTLNWRDTPQGRIPVYEDGTPMTPEDYDMLLEQHSQRADANRSRAAEAAAMRQAEADARAAQAQAEFNAGAGGVPWTASEMASGLSGAPRSNIPLDAELPVRTTKKRRSDTPAPVSIEQHAEDYGWTRVDSGEIERDPQTGKARRGGAWTIAAPAPENMTAIPLEGEDMDGMANATVAPNARRREDLERAGYRRALKNSPDGTPTWVYTTRGEDGYTDSESMGLARRGANGRQMSEGMSGGTEYQRRARISRMADELGISEAEVRAMLSEGGELPRGQTPSATEIGYNSYAAFDPVREKIRDKRRTEKAQRSADAHAAVVRNAQWRQNLQEWFNNPTVTPEQRQLASAILLRRGATPNDVDVSQNEGFQRGLAAGARQNINVTDQAMQQELMEQNRRKNDPSHAGASDIAAGKPDSPAAIIEVDRLAEEMDDTWGGFSWDNERALATRLQQPPYNMKKPEAEAAANRAANKRRLPWTQGKPPEAAPAGGGKPAAGDGRLPDGSPKSDAPFPV